MSTSEIVPPVETGIRPEDILAREIPTAQAVGFMAGCEIITQIIVHDKPDIVVYPQRGATPLKWTIDELLDARDELRPHVLDLPVGSSVDVNDPKAKLGGISKTEKIAIVNDSLDRMKQEGVYKPGVSRILIVDEVQKGGTLSHIAKTYRAALDQRGDNSVLTVVAAQDTRNKVLSEARKPAFTDLATNMIEGILAQTVTLPLFTVDRSPMLDLVQRINEARKCVRLDDFVTVPNVDSIRMFKTLARVYANPDNALQEIRDLRRHKYSGMLAETILQEELMEVVTDPREVRANGKGRIGVEDLYQWWTLFAKEVSKKRFDRGA